MKHLILLALTWSLAFSQNLSELCEIDNDGDGYTLRLHCDQENIERIHTIKDKSVSCGLMDVLRDNIKAIVNDGCAFNEFNLFENCKRLILRYAREFKSIRKETFSEMTQLEFIDVRHRNVEVVASAFSELPKLRHVQIIDNNLNMNELSFKGANQLRSLYVEGSSISSLPHRFFCDLNNLEHLNLPESSYTNLSAIDFTGLENVRFLNLDGNLISNLTGNWIYILKNLRYLILSDNHILDIDSMIFSQMQKLVGVSFKSNRIEQLNASTFSSLSNLRSLSLHMNNIKHIENGAFSTMKNLKKLDLSCNKLTVLGEYYFTGLDNLQYLSLKNNRLSSISDNAFPSLTKLIQLDLSNQEGLITINLNAFPQFIDFQTKTVIYTAINQDLDDFEMDEVQWFYDILSYSKKTAEVTYINEFLFRHFPLSQYADLHIDLHNLSQRVIDQSLIFGNLDLSNNRITLINVD